MGRKILFSVDGSPSSNNAIEWGCSHVLRPDDLLYIVHIHTRPSSFYLIDSSLSALYQEAETALAKKGQELLDKTSEVFTSKGFKVEKTILCKDSKEDIVQTAEDEEVDILIMGSRGLGAIKRVFLGSTADFCVQHAPCPVIVVKESEK